ncbi:hypothetical protein [Halomonas sp. A11-A]|uniref:hypothetical protein n=1 Tax=Halomonas sp. A11-A TaxID=2183985 RepID=UPI000D84EF87|nr:hypothetical protein [Halomonas sp. A11-A]PWV78270.1 hypothetical protein DER72_106146 [Halomonas sp. A11-A]
MSPEKEKRMLELMERYKNNMREIKERMSIIQAMEECHSKQKLFTGLIEIDIDLLYLQLRKINEVIMFSCVIASEAAEKQLNADLRRGWELNKIKRSLERLNQNYFPYPVKVVNTEDGGCKIEKYDKDDRVYLTEDELFDIYKDASNYVHAKRSYQYGSKEERFRILHKGFEHASKITRLLSHHWLPINDSLEYAVIMEYGDKKDIQVILMEREGEKIK